MGASIVAPGAPIPSPDFALDGGEEPEIAGIYVIDRAGRRPRRLGYCLANEFSDVSRCRDGQRVTQNPGRHPLQ